MTKRRKDPDHPKVSKDEASPKTDSFAELIGEMEDVERLGSDARRAPQRSEPGPTSHRRTQPGEPETEPMQFPKSHEPLLARRPHLSPTRFQRLCAGRILPGQTLDLHGHNRKSAHATLIQTLKAASAAGTECVLVIHGKGNRSESGDSVLRESMPNWLTDPDLRSHVLGFAPAQPRHGGRGAVYVLLS